MLNSAAFNRVALNAAAVAVALLASASWSAEATVTSAVPTHTHAARGDISCLAQAVFDSTRNQYAFWNQTAGATAVLDGYLLYNASGEWEAGATFHGFVLNVINAEAGFDGTADLLIIPNAIFGEGEWAAGSSAEFVPRLNGALSGSISAEATFVLDEALVTRYVEMSLSSAAEFFGESTYTSGGVTYHEALVPMNGSADFSNYGPLTATFINGAFLAPDTTMVGVATGIYAGAGQWIHTADFEMPANRTMHTSMMMTAGAEFSATSTHTQRAAGTFTAGASLSGGARVQHTARASIAGEASFSAVPLLSGGAAAFLTVTAEFSNTTAVVTRYVQAELTHSAGLSVTGSRQAQAEASWDGLGSSLLVSTRLTAKPAPDERQIRLSYDDRSVLIPEDDRTIQVTA